MELIACNFEFFPLESQVLRILRPVLSGCTEVRFPYSIGERNNNQFTFNFDSKLQERLIQSGARPAKLDLPPDVLKEYDFSFSFDSKLVVVEVEKANREKILYDFLKFHMYLRHGADLALLFLPKNYSHRSGEWDLFDWGKTRYQQSLDFGFGSQAVFDRILIIGYEQRTLEGAVLNRTVRASLIANRTVIDRG
ncbi:MAG: hypothetical protein ACRD9S_04280 [Pyrinomonadaceae bacterium]